jgi:hypothetical protein
MCIYPNLTLSHPQRTLGAYETPHDYQITFYVGLDIGYINKNMLLTVAGAIRYTIRVVPLANLEDRAYTLPLSLSSLSLALCFLSSSITCC